MRMPPPCEFRIAGLSYIMARMRKVSQCCIRNTSVLRGTPVGCHCERSEAISSALNMALVSRGTLDFTPCNDMRDEKICPGKLKFYTNYHRKKATMKYESGFRCSLVRGFASDRVLQKRARCAWTWRGGPSRARI